MKLLALASIIIGYFFSAGTVTAQAKFKYTSEPIRVDGSLDEAIWQEQAEIKDFQQNFPFDTSAAQAQTEVWMAYDANALYVAAKCYKATPNYVIQTLQRDFLLNGNDYFGVVLNPFNDGRNGFLFYVNPLGVLGEALIEDGGNLSTVWDNRWFANTVKSPSVYTVEIKIPWKTLRFNGDKKQWNVNFIRSEQGVNELSSWQGVPRNFATFNLAFSKPVAWSTRTPNPGNNISLIPSVTFNTNNNYREGTSDNTIIPSMDAKVAVTPSLNLDLTVNPDFSQVEVDRQVTNLTRFSIFFPERRNFFLENNDLFARFGFRQIRPFFSRRIGLFNGATVPILGGARLSGKLSEKWRVGFMNMQTEGLTDQPLLAQNYTVAAFQRDVFARSNIAGIFVNRQAFNGSEIDNNDFNRILGIDYNLASADNRWYGKFFHHQAFTPENSPKSLANASFLRYESPELFVMWNHEYVDKEYDAEVGFVPRNKMYDPFKDTTTQITYWRLEPAASYSFYPENSKINNHGPGIYLDHYMNSAFETTDYRLQLYYRVNFESSANARINYEEIYTYLFFPTDVTFTDQPSIDAGDYYYRNVNFTINSDSRRRLYGSIGAELGTYFSGLKNTYSISTSLRLPPFATISLNYQRDEIVLDEINPVELNLLGSQFNVSISKAVFFDTFLQYNTQGENININSRLQWRFKPMSDLFIVYTENYFPEWDVKNRALSLKLIYWFTS